MMSLLLGSWFEPVAYAAKCQNNGENWVLLTFTCYSGRTFVARFLACKGNGTMRKAEVRAQIERLKNQAENGCQESDLRSDQGVATFKVFPGQSFVAAHQWCSQGEDCTDGPIPGRQVIVSLFGL